MFVIYLQQKPTKKLTLCEIRGGAVASWLVRSSPVERSSPGQGHFVEFFGKTQLSQCPSPPRCIYILLNVLFCSIAEIFASCVIVLSERENFADIKLRGMRDRSMRSETEMAREIQLTDWSTAPNLSNRSSRVQIPRDICTRFGRYLYSTRCSWIIKMGTGEFNAGVTLRWTGIPSRGSRNTPSRFMPQKSEIRAGLMGHLARMQTLPLPLPLWDKSATSRGISPACFFYLCHAQQITLQISSVRTENTKLLTIYETTYNTILLIKRYFCY